jgi:hypothetical protein
METDLECIDVSPRLATRWLSLRRHGKALIYQNGVLCWSAGDLISNVSTLGRVRIILYRHWCGGRFGKWMGQLHIFAFNAGRQSSAINLQVAIYSRTYQSKISVCDD